MSDFDRRKTAVPVVQMNDVGRRAEPFDQFERGMVKKSESLVVFRVAVDRIAVKKRRRVNQKRRRTVGFRIEGFCLIACAAPINPKVVNRRMPQIFALGLQVAGRDQKRIFADRTQSLRQRARDIAQTACF
jgi:hypothetical protein